VYLRGNFNGSINLGGNTLTNPCVPDPQDPSSYCHGDHFFAKLQADGTHVWSKRFVNDNEDYAGWSIASDVSDAGEVYIVTHGTSAFSFGGAVVPSDSTPGCGPNGCDTDTAVVKLSSAGAFLWGKRFGDGTEDQDGWDIAARKFGDIAIVGTYKGSVNFGGGALGAVGLGPNVFVARFTSAGAHVWSNRFGNGAGAYRGSIAFDGAGNTIVTGYFAGSINFGGMTLNSAGSTDIYIAKFDNIGNHLWSARFGDIQSQESYSPRGLDVAADASGNVVLIGELNGSADFGGGALTSTADNDLFVAKFDLNGAHLWSKRFDDAGVPGRLAIDPSGAIMLTGSSQSALDFGGGSLPGPGGFLVELAPDGSHVWSRRFPGWSGYAVATGTQFLLVTGALTGSDDFGAGQVSSAGSTDAFVAKFVNP
jgi:hypothetical protein